MKSAVPVGLLLVALVTLATLQYQWIGQISLTERQKLESSLVRSASRFVQDFTKERERLYSALESRYRYSGDLSTLIARHREWAQSAQHPDLVRALYVADTETTDNTRLRLREVHVEEESGEPVQWPGDLMNLEMALERELDPPRGRFGPTPFRYRPNPGDAMVLVTAMMGPSSPEGRQRSDQRSTIPGDPGPRRPNGWVIARLDRSVMTDKILPALADRHFPRNEGQSYRLSVVDVDDSMNQVYTTSGPWNQADLEWYDYAIDLFGNSVFQPLLRSRTVNSLSGAGGRGPGTGDRGRGRGPGAGGSAGPSSSRGPIGPAGPGGPDGSVGGSGGASGPYRQFEVSGLQQGGAPLGHHWRLLVKNEAGSLEAAVEQLRLRNLGVSFGVFLVLSAAAFMLVFSGQRTRALGKLHMEFAAGVSHELRTPLAIIRSAAFNLRTGVIRDPQNVERYGEIVQKEERRLSGMVEQLMAFAETQSGSRRYDLTAVNVTDVVDQALKALVFGDDVKVKVERRIPANLPSALADPVALSQCLQNLIGNAVKYGQRAGTVELDIEAVADPANHKICLSVMDRGNGVPAKDVPHLFEAFYRGSNISTTMPGNGIGLHLVRKIVESQKGAVTYQARFGGGAAFILTVPSA